MGKQLRVVFDRETIAERVRKMGEEIDAYYRGEPVVIICVLKGAFLFFSDLVRAVKTPAQLDFVRLASYGNNTETSHNISFTKDVELPLEGRHVLVVEDIIDTGRTIAFLLNQLKARGAKSLKVAAMIDKSERREVGSVHADFVGFDLDAGFIVGYGLDYAEQYRGLPDICELI